MEADLLLGWDWVGGCLIGDSGGCFLEGCFYFWVGDVDKVRNVFVVLSHIFLALYKFITRRIQRRIVVCGKSCRVGLVMQKSAGSVRL